MRLFSITLLLSACAAQSPRPDDATPTSVVGQWAVTAAYNPAHHRSKVDSVLWLELRPDGSALVASCPTPEFTPTADISCRTEHACWPGRWTVAGHDLEVHVGAQTWRGRIDYIEKGWAWTTDVLGPSVTGVLVQEQPLAPIECR